MSIDNNERMLSPAESGMATPNQAAPFPANMDQDNPQARGILGGKGYFHDDRAPAVETNLAADDGDTTDGDTETQQAFLARQRGESSTHPLISIKILTVLALPNATPIVIIPLNTQTDDTNDRYTKKFADLIAKWLESSPIDRRIHFDQHADKPGLSGFTDWVIDTLVNDLSPATWRGYRAALLHVLMQLNAEFRASTDLCAQSADRLRAISSSMAGIRLAKLRQAAKESGGSDETRNFRRDKARPVPKEDLAKLLTVLSNKRSPYAGIAARMLLSSRLVGLRPVEWWNAEVERVDGCPALVVRNAKHNVNIEDSRARACGAIRILMLTDMPDGLIGVIRETIDLIKAYDLSPQARRSFMKTIAKLIAQACRDIWLKKHYSLYSCRHALAADLKLVYPVEEVAAIMGHAASDSASAHYSHHRSGRASGKLEPLYPLPIAHPDNVKLVRMKRQTFNPDYTLKALKEKTHDEY